MDSYGDAYMQSNPSNDKNVDKKEDDSNFASYDPYTSNKSLQQKIGNILEGVEQKE